MAPSTIHRQNILNLRNTNTRLDHASIQTSGSSLDDELDALVSKRRRFSHEPSSPMQQSIQRSHTWIGEEEEDEQDIDESIPIEEDTHSDSTGLDEEDSIKQRVYTSLFGVESDDDVFDQEEMDAGFESDDDVFDEEEMDAGFESDDDVFEEVDASLETEEQLQNGGVGSTVVLTDPDVLDCPICLDPLSAPIFQCENGHIACSSCCTKMKRKNQSGRDICPCPFCDLKIGSRRNRCRGLEKFIKSISRISCKNAKYGCKKIMPYSMKSEHEQMCPHASCNCPFPSCYFAGSSKKLYRHFRIQHAAFTTPFTYNTPFSIDVDIDQKHIFLQELHKNVIFILNHEAGEHGRTFNIDCVGVSMLKTSFVYKLTAKNKNLTAKSMDRSRKIKSVPEVYEEWSKLTPEKDYLTVPFKFAGYDALLSLDVCIKKISISSEFDEEAGQVAGEAHGNDDDDHPLGSLQVVLTDPGALDCSICQEPLTTSIYQCQKGHLACSSCCPKMKRICLLGKSKELFERCRGLEKVLETVRISCKNAECKETMPYNTMSEHEQVCPHATCFCPHPPCPFTGRSKNLYSHFAIQHAISTTRFTYNTTFSLHVGRYQKYMFLQEQHENVIFVLNHQVEEHASVFNIDCVGTSALNGYFVYKLTAKTAKTSWTSKSEPKISTKWSEHTSRKNYLRVPSVFSGYTGLVSLSVCIKKGFDAMAWFVLEDD